MINSLILSECPPGLYGTNCSKIGHHGSYGRLCKEGVLLKGRNSESAALLT